MSDMITPSHWEAWLKSPGGPLRFGLRLDAAGKATLINGQEVIEAVMRTQRATATTFPVLMAGLSDKDAASAAFPALDRVLAYPTFLVLDRDREVTAVCTGFQGAATGPDGQTFLARLTQTLERALSS